MSERRRQIPSAGLSRRGFMRTGSYLGAAAYFSRFSGAWAAGSDDLTSKSTVEIAALLKSGTVKAVDVVKACYARIDQVNPKLNAVVATCRARALAEAMEADIMHAQGLSLGPLHGVPFTIKDSFDTVGVVSTGGTLGRKHYVPGKDATVVARLRDAGAILLGKTNTPEFTLGGGGKGTVNLVYGLTKNPYNLNYQPSGSSGGGGAIVAAGGAFFDIGSDYGGSIRGPAYANGIAGIKPTYGRVPRTGHIVGYGGPFDNFQETGPLARTVADLGLLLPIVAGPDDWDAAMAPVPLGDPQDVDLKSLRIAYYTTNGLKNPTREVQEVVDKTVAYFKKLGCAMNSDRPPKMGELSDIRNKFNGADDREYIRRLLKTHGTDKASPGLRTTGNNVSSADFTRLCEEMDAIKSEQLAWFAQYDLIICPASQRAPIPLDFPRLSPEQRRGASYTSQYNTTGWPAGVVRVSTSQEAPGLPLGVQVVAQPWQDHVLLAALAHIESQSGGWQSTSL